MSMSPAACLNARICFTIAVGLLLTKIVLLAISTESSTLNRVIATFIMFGVIGTIYVEALQWIKTRELLQLSGVLTPDNKPTPSNPCGSIPKNAIALFFGNSVCYAIRFPYIVIQVGDKQLIVLNNINGKITISAKFFSKDGKIVAELEGNTFTINQNNYYKIERPNYHTLIVYDQENNQILNIEYLNPVVIKILGIFYSPNRPPIIINEELQIIGNLRLSKVCLGDTVAGGINLP